MISLPNQPKIVKKEDNKALIEIDALYPGYGITIGNALRRVLLSSLSGTAVTQVKIKGASHEFTTIPGVLEDVILLMLNLKKLRFKLLVDESQKATLKIKGEKEVKGSDFNFPSQVELVNKDCHIATLTSKSAELEMEILIEKGIGFSSRESRKKEKSEIGAIALDAIFTPVRKVSFKVENMRVGDRTDYDKLFIEVETDGIISPEEAVLKASETLVKHFSLVESYFGEQSNKEKENLEKSTNKEKSIRKGGDKKVKKEIKKTHPERSSLKAVVKKKDEKVKKGKKTK